MKIIRANQLSELLNLSKTSIWRLEKAGELPPKYKISERAVGWLEEDIKEWLETKKIENSSDRQK